MDGLHNISPLELRNAGVSVGTAAMQLASGTENLAQDILRIVANAAEKKLEAAAQAAKIMLEEAQSEGPKSLDETRRQEREILNAWARWYDEALAAVLGIPVTEPSEPLCNSVNRERQLLHTRVQSLLAANGL